VFFEWVEDEERRDEAGAEEDECSHLFFSFAPRGGAFSFCQQVKRCRYMWPAERALW
jgi:hypothetical protein